MIPAIDKIAVAPDGMLWVARRGVAGEATPTDIFLRGGEYLGTLPPSAPYPIAFTPEGHVIVVERDDLDVPRVTVYRIVGLADPVEAEQRTAGGGGRGRGARANFGCRGGRG